jgi:hypothetical protein
MSIHAIYRLCIWLPILIPGALIRVYETFGLRISDGIVAEMVAYSLLYGGLPYAALALWATWWVGGRPEDQIRRLMWRAPLLMLAVFVPLALTVGLLVGNMTPFVGVALLGAAVILPLGYSYIGLALLVRRVLGPRPARAGSAS